MILLRVGFSVLPPARPTHLQNTLTVFDSTVLLHLFVLIIQGQLAEVNAIELYFLNF